jgi:hypothetical protein
MTLGRITRKHSNLMRWKYFKICIFLSISLECHSKKSTVYEIRNIKIIIWFVRFVRNLEINKPELYVYFLKQEREVIKRLLGSDETLSVI